VTGSPRHSFDPRTIASLSGEIVRVRREIEALTRKISRVTREIGALIREIVCVTRKIEALIREISRVRRKFEALWRCWTGCPGCCLAPGLARPYTWLMPTLVTIPFSHFCEKARWALDHARLAYSEEGHVPGLHRRAVKRARGRAGSVPVLVLDDGHVLDDSPLIVRWADSHAASGCGLLPPEGKARDEALELERHSSCRCGPSPGTMNENGTGRRGDEELVGGTSKTAIHIPNLPASPSPCASCRAARRAARPRAARASGDRGWSIRASHVSRTSPLAGLNKRPVTIADRGG
jgi:glutathione S-transferase